MNQEGFAKLHSSSVCRIILQLQPNCTLGQNVSIVNTMLCCIIDIRKLYLFIDGGNNYYTNTNSDRSHNTYLEKGNCLHTWLQWSLPLADDSELVQLTDHDNTDKSTWLSSKKNHLEGFSGHIRVVAKCLANCLDT